MRKVTYLIAGLFLALTGSAQMIHSTKSEINQAKNTRTGLVENFDAGTDIPSTWQNNSTAVWTLNNPSYNWATDHTSGSGRFAVFNSYTYMNNAEGILVTPKFDFSASNSTFSCWLNYYKIGTATDNATAQLYIAVSNDEGVTWTERAANIISGQAGTGWYEYTLDLTSFEGTDYTGSEVMVRFRAISNYGTHKIGLDDISIGDGVMTNPDLLVEGHLNTLYSMIPTNQITEVIPSAVVTNNGTELTSETNVEFKVIDQSFTTTQAVSVPMANGSNQTITASEGFTPTSTGTYKFAFNAEVENDNYSIDNKDTLELVITDNELGYDHNGYTGQSGSSQGAIIGNKFVFTSDCGLNGAKFYITDQVDNDYECTVKVYELNNNVVGNVIIESEPINIVRSTNNWYQVEFPNITMHANDTVLIAVDNKDAREFMAIACFNTYHPNLSFGSVDGETFTDMANFGFAKTFIVRAITTDVASCPTPSTILLNEATTNSANLSWTENGSATSWNIQYGPIGFSLGNGTTTTANENSIELTGLLNSTSYDFYVQAECNGDWAGPFNFKTDCDVISNYPYTNSFEHEFPIVCGDTVDVDDDGNHWRKVNYKSHTGGKSVISDSYLNDGSQVLNPDNYLITPQFNINANNLEFTFWVAAVSPDYSNEKYSILVSTTDDEISSFTEVYTETLPNEDSSWNKKAISLSTYEGQNIYIAIRHWGSSDIFAIAIDDIAVDYATGNLEENMANYSLYPNPANNTITIENANNTTIEIIDMMGKVVLTTNVNSKLDNINISNLRAGTYTIRINNNNQITTKKISVLR